MINQKYDLIYFMGDSFTWAAGLDDDLKKEVNVDNRFSNLIGSHYNIPIMNLAKSGCSNYTIFQTVYEDIYKFVKKKKKVLAIISYTSEVRIDLHHNKIGYPIPLSDNFSFFKEYMLESYNYDFCIRFSTDHILAIHTLFERFNIDYVEAYTTDPILTIPFENKTRCLDQTFMDITQPEGRFTLTGHANALGNARIANAFIKKIDQLYG